MTNEQRAHDLTLITLKRVLDNPEKFDIHVDNDKIVQTTVDLYCSIYSDFSKILDVIFK